MKIKLQKNRKLGGFMFFIMIPALIFFAVLIPIFKGAKAFSEDIEWDNTGVIFFVVLGLMALGSCCGSH